MNDSTERTLFGAVWHYRWLALFLLIVFAAAGFAYTVTQPVQYFASATLIIEDPRASTLFQSLAGVSPQRYITDQVAVLASTTVADKAAEIARPIAPSLDSDAILEGQRIQSDSSSNAILVGFVAADPTLAETGANAIVSAYQDVRRDQAVENAASALEQLDNKILAIEGDLLDIRASLDQLRSPSSGSADLNAEFEAARLRFGELSAKQRDGTIEPDERTELADLLAQFQTIQVVASIDAQRPEVAALVREQAAAIDRRSTLAERRDQIEVDAELAAGGVGLSSPARGAIPSGPDQGRNVAVSLVLGLLAAAGIPYLLSLRRHGFESRFQPEQIVGAHLLAEIPDFRDEGIKSSLPVRDTPKSAAAEAFRFGITGIELQSSSRENSSEPTGAPAPASRLPNTIVIVSASVGDGKTTVSGNLAFAAARRGRRVLLIDADFGDQQLTTLVGLAAAHHIGLTDLVEKGAHLSSVVQKIEVGRGVYFDLMSRGTARVNTPDFFRSSAAATFFENIGDEYDLVLIDCPPLLHVAYTSLLARYADTALVVIPHGAPVSTAEDVRDRLDLVGTPIAGYVYNRAPLRPEMTSSEGSMKDVLGSGHEAR